MEALRATGRSRRATWSSPPTACSRAGLAEASARGDWSILDEAQAIKNSGTQQTRAVKELKAAGRIAMTGTPVENRLSDLWSLFDFLNPGLLGTRQGVRAIRQAAAERHASRRIEPLRTLVRPYILRRLKTDKRVIADLPDKTEVQGLLRPEQAAGGPLRAGGRELAEQLEDGRRHPAARHRAGPADAAQADLQSPRPDGSATATTTRSTAASFARLAELCEELAQRQEKVLVFTQFREIAEPLAEFLAGRLRPARAGAARRHGRRASGASSSSSFQREDGPPFFVLSLKAGGTGLNLTAASHVIHFDRWWNPAVENQATDRAFRIGQKRNVLVHKFVCRGTVEERIDAMIAEKSGLADEMSSRAARSC